MKDIRTPEEKARWRKALSLAGAILLLLTLAVGAITVIKFIWAHV